MKSNVMADCRMLWFSASGGKLNHHAPGPDDLANVFASHYPIHDVHLEEKIGFEKLSANSAMMKMGYG
jgi:hypothetical protein